MLDSTTTVPFFASDLYTDYPDFEQQNNFVSRSGSSNYEPCAWQRECLYRIPCC